MQRVNTGGKKVKKLTPRFCVCVTMVAMSLIGCSKTTTTSPNTFNNALTVVIPPPEEEAEPVSAPADPEPAEPQPEPPVIQTAARKVEVERSAPLAGARELVEPVVVLTEAHKKTCQLFVGDKIPDTTVTDIQGTNHQLRRLLGDRVTVMIFWNDKSAMGMEQFRRIPIDVLAEFGSRGVQVVAAHVGGEIATVRNLTGNAAGKITSLVDKDGKFFSQVATASVPRTYVVDAEGKILWFDIEYSQSTQRSLRNALAYYLSNS